MTNFMKTTTTNKVDMIAIFNYISHELHRLVSQESDVSFRVQHYIPDDPDRSIRGPYLENLHVTVGVKLKVLGTIYTTQPIYICYTRKEYTEATLSAQVEQALQKILAELKSSYRKDLVKSLSDGADFFKSLGK